jgi:hypothetical protein
MLQGLAEHCQGNACPDMMQALLVTLRCWAENLRTDEFEYGVHDARLEMMRL